MPRHSRSNARAHPVAAKVTDTTNEEMKTPIKPPAVLPPLLSAIEEQMEKKIATATVHDLCNGRYAYSNVSIKLQVTTPLGLFLDEMRISRSKNFDKPDESEWKVVSGPWDLQRSEFVIHGKAPSLLKAWLVFQEQMQQVGQCEDCACITHVDDGGCRPCQIRAALNVGSECTICNLVKTNIYHLRCGHKMCRHCAKRCATDKARHCEEGELKKCPFGCTRRFRINNGLQEDSGCDCSDSEEDCAE